MSALEFDRVSFSYAGATSPVLLDASFAVPEGAFALLVGATGSGKSTLVDLVPRYHDIREGELLIDGKNVKDVSIQSLRALIGNVNQEAILFNDTFYNNITFGVEAILWSDNSDLKLYAYCDIGEAVLFPGLQQWAFLIHFPPATHLRIITYIVKPMSTLIISRRLHLIASLQSVELPSATAVRHLCLFLTTLPISGNRGGGIPL